jgi:hypothetical protein
MEIGEMTAVFAILVVGFLLVVGILFGPSLYSSYQNWKIARAGKK